MPLGGIFPKNYPLWQRHLSLTVTHVWSINTKFQTLCDFDNFVRIVNNQPTPSNWDIEPVVMKRSRSHRLTILSFFCLFCISQQLLDINLFILTCPKLLERGWPLSGGWLTQSFDQMKSYRECGAKTNNQQPGEVRTQQRMRGLGGESALRITSDFALCTAAM